MSPCWLLLTRHFGLSRRTYDNIGQKTPKHYNMTPWHHDMKTQFHHADSSPPGTLVCQGGPMTPGEAAAFEVITTWLWCMLSVLCLVLAQTLIHFLLPHPCYNSPPREILHILHSVHSLWVPFYRRRKRKKINLHLKEHSPILSQVLTLIFLCSEWETLF